MVLNALSIDVEEWYQTVLFNRNYTGDSEMTNLPENIADILDLLDRHNVKATFFVVASVAEKYPDMIRTISGKGHEICSHGYSHKLVYKDSKQYFIKDVGYSLEVLSKLADKQILGYRAPTWSITKKMDWAIDSLCSLGLKYDSSIYPIGINLFDLQENYRRFPYEIKEDFIEFPPSTFKFLGYNFPFSGGIFLRFFPLDFIKKQIHDINKDKHPAVVYLHPWEFDHNYPKVALLSWKHMIQYGNLESVKIKLESLLETFRFCPMRECLQLLNY
jgi:polysaccharide deacetylase family protein (PEP-CTERM system associated)